MEIEHTQTDCENVYVRLTENNDEIYYVLVELKNKKIK